tara:strand:- start:7113 stop:7490 length:378 start_codon:yes stop_codon:yes gene_type:complete
MSAKTEAKADAMEDLYQEACAERDALVVQLQEMEQRATRAENMVKHQDNVITTFEIRLEGATVPPEHQHEFPGDLQVMLVPRSLVECSPGEKIVIKTPPTIVGLSDVDAVEAGELPPDYLEKQDA